MNKQPEITERTRETFIQALWIMLKKQPINKITIGELSRVAGYNRGTFYEYFNDIYDIMREAEDELVCAFQNHMTEKFPEGAMSPADEDAALASAVEFFDEQEDKLLTLIGENGDPSFFDTLSSELFPFLNRIAGIKYNKFSDYITVHATSTVVNILREWIKKGKDLEKKELVELLFMLIGKGTLGVAESEDFR
ncbi:MAG: TetR/AcrR family transcriptional regulator [Clostridia bacterium]|nr:TetR/AcrR family transcriptional regulator [Clostridia bacterium]